MRREGFVLNEMSWWRAMPIGLSCLLHVGLVTGLILGQQWVTRVVALQPPVLPVQLVTLEVAEPPREPAPPAPPRRDRTTPIRRPEPPRPREAAAARVEEPAPQPITPAPVSPPAEVAPGPAAVTATLPAINEPAPAPGQPAPAPSGPALVASKPSTTTPDGVTRTARPQGGYQVRPAYPAAPRRLGIQGTTMLRVHVLADGRIGDVLVERSAGHPDLDQAATDAVRRWRFEPARRGDDAVAMWVLLPVEFRLTQ
jgi:periplasmic protein TonB